MLTDIKKLCEKANKYIQDPDVIIDVYDMTYAWVSQYHCDITGYSESEQINTRIDSISKLTNGQDTSKMAMEVTTPYKKFQRDMIITTKTGDTRNVNVDGIIIIFNDQPYLVGKMSKVEEK